MTQYVIPLSGIDLQQAIVATGTTSVLLLPRSPDRRYLALINTGTVDVTLCLGAVATIGAGWVLPPGGGLVYESNAIPINALSVISSAPSSVTVWYG